jgi:hypothetical protein
MLAKCFVIRRYVKRYELCFLNLIGVKNMNIINRFKKLTLWNKIGFFGSFATFIGVLLAIIFYFTSGNENNNKSNIDSISFKIGYYSGRTIWSAVGGLNVFCISDELTECEKYITLLDESSDNSEMNPDFFFRQLTSMPDIYNYISKSYMDSLKSNATRESLKKNVSAILNTADNKFIKEGLLENLSVNIINLSSEIISNAGQVCKDKNDRISILAHIPIGGEIAHIEQLIIMGSVDGNPDIIVPECRRIFKILIEPISPEHQKIQIILASILPNYQIVYERRDSLAYNDFVEIVGKIKNNFIQSKR